MRGTKAKIATSSKKESTFSLCDVSLSKFSYSCCNAFVTCIVQTRTEPGIQGQLAAVFCRVTDFISGTEQNW